MSGLPDNWTHAALESLGQWGSGGTPPRTNPAYFEGGKIPWLIIGDLNDRVVTNAATHITEAGLANSSAKLLPPETLLVAMYGSIGKLGITGIECATNQAIAFCKPNTEITYLRYLFYAVMNAKDGLVALGQGGAQQNISQGILKAYEVPLAPLGEQPRIANKLDAVLARVDACRDRLDRIPTILKRFRQSVLAAATSGKLTEDWRTEQAARMQSKAKSGSTAHDSVHLGYAIAEPPENAEDLPDDWRWIAVGDLAKKVVDGVHKKPNYVETGIPFLTVRNLTAGPGLDFSNTSFVTHSDHEEFCKRTHPERDDILISKDGTLGVVRLIDTDQVFSIFVSVALIKLRDKRMSRYMRIALESPVLQKQMVGVGTGLQHIHLRDLRQDVAPVPPLDEQTEIVRRVEILFAFADRLEARYTTASAQIEKLTPALLAKAFRGELVPQDPKDERASVLLERVRAKRGELVSEKPKRGRKTVSAVA